MAKQRRGNRPNYPAPEPKPAPVAPNRLLTVEVRGVDVPLIDLNEMTEDEKELFFNVVRAVSKTSSHPITAVAQMPSLFASMSRAAMLFAGMHVTEYRKLKEELGQDQDSIPIPSSDLESKDSGSRDEKDEKDPSGTES